MLHPRVFIFAALLGHVACMIRPAVIGYSQLGVCKNAQTGAGLVSAPPSHAVVIFRVTQIDNRQTDVDWLFDSTRLQVNPPSSPQQNLGGTGPVAIPRKAVVPVNALVGILVESGNEDGRDAANVNYFLLYAPTPSGPGTLGAKSNSSQVVYPFDPDCNVIASRP